MEAVSLPDERTNFVSMNRLRHGWAYQKLANQWRNNASQHPILSAICLRYTNDILRYD